MNPYAPPQEQFRVRLHHGRLKYFFVALCTLPMVLALLLVVSKDLAPLVRVVSMITGTAAWIPWLLWVHRTWSLMPNEPRGGTSPAAAVIMCLIPGYSIWWVFVLHHRVALSLHRALEKYPTPKASPMTLAWVAPASPIAVVLFILFVALTAPVSSDGTARHFMSVLPVIVILALSMPVLMFAFMARVDACNEEILDQRAEKKARRSKKARRQAAEGPQSDASVLDEELARR
jgi:hypothetical protein